MFGYFSNNMLYPKEDKERRKLLYAVSPSDQVDFCTVSRSPYDYHIYNTNDSHINRFYVCELSHQIWE